MHAHAYHTHAHAYNACRQAEAEERGDEIRKQALVQLEESVNELHSLSMLRLYTPLARYTPRHVLFPPPHHTAPPYHDASLHHATSPDQVSTFDGIDLLDDSDLNLLIRLCGGVAAALTVDDVLDYAHLARALDTPLKPTYTSLHLLTPPYTSLHLLTGRRRARLHARARRPPRPALLGRRRA